MYLHANAKLGLAGRLALVRAIEEGLSLKAAAAAFCVSPATAHRCWHRWLGGGRQASALVDRSSRPHRSPRLLAAELQERICDCRKVERFHQTMAREWAYGLAYRTHRHRNAPQPRSQRPWVGQLETLRVDVDDRGEPGAAHRGRGRGEQCRRPGRERTRPLGLADELGALPVP